MSAAAGLVSWAAALPALASDLASSALQSAGGAGQALVGHTVPSAAWSPLGSDSGSASLSSSALGTDVDAKNDPHTELHAFYYFGSCVTFASSLFVICSYIKVARERDTQWGCCTLVNAQALITVCSCVLTLAPYLLHRALNICSSQFKACRQHPSSLIFWRSVSDVIFSLQFIILFSLSTQANRHCNVFSFMFQFSVLASPSWYFMNAVDLLRSMRNPFTEPASSMPLYHVYVWGMSFATSVAITASGRDEYRDDMQLCWTSPSTDSVFNYVNWITFFIPTLLYYVFSVGTVIYAAVRLRKGLDQTFATRQLVLRNGIRYVAGFCAYWTFAGIIYGIIILKSSGKDAESSAHVGGSLALYAIFAVTIAVRGVVDVVIWVYNQRVHKIYQLWWHGLPHDSPADVGLQDVDINRALRSEVLIFSTTGIALAIERANAIPPSNIMPTEEQYPVSLDPFPRESRNMHSVVEITVSRADFSAQRASASKSGGGSVLSPSNSLPSSPTSSAAAAHDSYHADFSGASNSSSACPDVEKVPFLDYAPQVFRYLRLQFGIDERRYARSIQGRTEAMVEKFTEGRGGAFFYFSEDGEYIVKTLTPSEGKFLTRFLPHYVEYVSSHPATLLSRFVGFHAITLYNLTIHFMVMQSVFLTTRKVHERYDLKGSTVDRHATKSAPKPVSKGSMLGPGKHERRGAFRKEVLKDNDLNRTIRLSAPDRDAFLKQVKRDANFLRKNNIMDYSLLLGVHHSSHAVPMMSPLPGRGGSNADAAGGSPQRGTPPSASATLQLSPSPATGTLASSLSPPTRIGSMDESFPSSLPQSPSNVSSHAPRQAQHSLSAPRAGVFQSCDGGVQASIIEGPGIYFFGLIDILQEYDTNKKLEHFAKIYLRCKGNGISAIPPDPYAERFISFMRDITRSDEEDIPAARNQGVSVSTRNHGVITTDGQQAFLGAGQRGEDDEDEDEPDAHAQPESVRVDVHPSSAGQHARLYAGQLESDDHSATASEQLRPTLVSPVRPAAASVSVRAVSPRAAAPARPSSASLFARGDQQASFNGPSSDPTNAPQQRLSGSGRNAYLQSSNDLELAPSSQPALGSHAANAIAE